MKSTPDMILNGSRPKPAELARFILAISDTGRLRSSGGYLFKTCLDKKTVVISICPAISEGQRLHHYDLKVPDTEHVLGAISATGEFTMLFKTIQGSLSGPDRKRWGERYIAFSAALLSSGYSGAGRLDWITRQIIRESGIFETIPETLAEMAGFDGPADQ